MKKYYLPIILATVITLIIRFTVYTEDCNLLVVAVTWIIIFIALLLVRWVLSVFRQ